MSGHNKFSQIKHKKAKTDAQKSKIFSKFSKLITQESKKSNGDLSSSGLKTAIDRARAENMPNDAILRAVKKASTGADSLEAITYEAYGPGGCALIIETLTDNRNRTAAEIKHLLSEHGIALAGIGSAIWAFEKREGEWIPTVTVSITDDDVTKLEEIVDALEEHDDVQGVYTNAE